MQRLSNRSCGSLFQAKRRTRAGDQILIGCIILDPADLKRLNEMADSGLDATLNLKGVSNFTGYDDPCITLEVQAAEDCITIEYEAEGTFGSGRSANSDDADSVQ